MKYKVCGRTPSGRALSRSLHETAEAALARMVELMTHCMVDVHVIDPTGRRLTPTEFATEMAEEPHEADSSNG